MDSKKLKKYLPLFLTLLLIIGIIIRLINLDRSLWHDEIVSMHFAEYSIGQLLPTVENDPHPGTFYLILKFWSISSTGEFYLRLLPLFFEVGAISIGSILIYQYFNPTVSMIFTLLMVFNPASFVISQLLRNYSILSLFTVLFCWSASRLYTRGTPSRWDKLLLITFGIMVLYSHYAGMFVITLIAFCLLWNFFDQEAASRKVKFYEILIFVIIWVLAFLPGVMDVLNQPSNKWAKPLSTADFLNNFNVLMGGFSFLGVVSIRFWIGIIFFTSMIILGCIGFYYVWLKKQEFRPFVVVSLVPILYFSVAWSQQRAYRLRYTAPFAIPIVLCISIGFLQAVKYLNSEINFREKIINSLMIGLPLFLICSLNLYRFSTTMATVQRDWKSLSRVLSQNNAERLLFQTHHKQKTCLDYYVSPSTKLVEFSDNQQLQSILEHSTPQAKIYLMKEKRQPSIEDLPVGWNDERIEVFPGQLTLELYKLRNDK